MPDVFDTIAVEEPKKDIFDALPSGDIFDSVGSPSVGRDSVEPPPDVLASANPEQYYKPEDHPIAENAASAALDVLGGFIPRTAGQAAQMATPLASAPDELKQSYAAIRDWIGGKPIDEINKEHFPESQTLVEADKTPAFSKERFKAAFQTIADLGMAAGIGRGVAEKVAAPDGSTESRPTSSTAGFVPPATDEVVSTPQPLTASTPDAANVPQTATETPLQPSAEPANLEVQRSGGLPVTAGQPETAAVATAEQTPGGTPLPLVPPDLSAEAASPALSDLPEIRMPTPEEFQATAIDHAQREMAPVTEESGGSTESRPTDISSTESVFGFGPGAASAAEPLSIGSQIKQLTNTIADDLRTARPAPMQSRVQRAINAVGGKFVSVRESLGRAANTARATWLAIKNGYLRPPVEGEFKNAVKDWQGADQRTSFEVRNFAAKLRGEIKDPSVREAITNYIQADGNADLLRQRAAASNIKYRPGYEAALNLNDAQKTLAANVRQYFDAQLQDGINAGVLDHGLENYINQMWKRPNKFTQELQADLQAGKLQTNFQFARKRVFDSFFDGEQAGYAPASKDVSALVAAYDLSFNRSMAARGFVKALRDSKAADGEPVAKFSGMTQPIQHGDAPPEAYLIRSRSMPESAVAKDGRKYEIVDHPALRGWKFVVQDGAKAPAYFQADMLVHPDHAAALKNILGSSQFRSGKLSMITSPLLKAGAIAKQTKLSLSLFHLDQEGLHGLFHRVNPANLDRINFDDPKQWSLVRNGLQVADYSAMELFAEGLRGGGLVSKIPVLGKIQNAFNEFLFKDYIPRLKMTMALHAMERNIGRYPNLAPDVVAELTARQANAAFGELNYKLMARNPTFQDFLRLTVLAPDFLEARSRFIGQALKPYGREQQMALLLGGATMYVAARALNQWLDNDPHWGKPFSVVYNGREYRLRTVMGDVGEAFTDPRRFFYNRFSPWLKSGVTFGTGRDYRGIKLSNWEQVKDALSWLVPIPFGKQENASVAQRLLGSAGVSNKPAETAIDRTYKAALKFKEGLTDPKVQAEVKRAQQETYAQSDYSKVNRAILDGDKERATTEIVDLLKAGKDAATISKFYSNLPAKPFTGSQALEASWMRTMSPPERAQYNSARNQRINMSRTFFSLFGNALRQYRAEQNRQ